ncbi:nuclease-related domain-containing protein [Neobacillus sp. FSL H8-0543]|uniref:nuclease-related domain-containing protein n=1 Tax=Neobacillus sp. FSL H8-0543 TaxID=2954672 RepID=UPI00315872FC
MSPRIVKLKVLDARIPTTNSRKMEVLTEYNNRIKGYKGEKSLEFYLDPLIQSKDYHVFHEIRLLSGKYYFQIDFLILCHKFALALEVKKRSRDWYFDEFNQAYLLFDGAKEKIQNPVAQAKLQSKKLKQWLDEHQCEEVPIHYLFVNSHEKSKITCEDGNDQFKNMCNSEALIDKIELIEKFYKEEKLTRQDVRKIKRLLLTKHTPDDPDILKYFNFTPKDLLPGVQCPKCDSLPMKYHYGVWTCLHCKEKSKTAHIKAIEDYFLLIKPSITNSELRHFLQIDSIKSANNILKSLNLPYIGNRKGRVYYRPTTPICKRDHSEIAKWQIKLRSGK